MDSEITNNKLHLMEANECSANTHRTSFIAGTMAFVTVYCGLKFITGRAIVYFVKSVLRPPSVDINDKRLLQRIKSSFWSFVVYTFLATYGLLYITRTDWLLHPSQYVHIIKNPPVSIFFHYYAEFMHYVLALGFLLVEPRGRDFSQMFAHHCLTLFLISVSYRSSLLRYGVVVMIIHDTGDPFLEMAKICKYLNLQVASGIIFVLFSIVFFSLRIVFFPLFVIGSAINFTILSPEVNWTHRSLTGGLVLLLLINVHWMFQIVKVELDTIARHSAASQGNFVGKQE